MKDHPVILRLIGIRSYLEKIRPIDARLKYQVDKLLRAAQMAKSTEDEVANGTFIIKFLKTFLSCNFLRLSSKISRYNLS